ncbi:DUF885 domain-containing protein [[Eubacterium] hominis]|uniref:DUF885 domain-containing protein n=1 Tax=[Eubacterium] hominis TaxID=2764325 RepID=UPI003A4DBA53
MKNRKQFRIIALSILLIATLGGCTKKDAGEEQQKFDEFINRQFVETMESDYMSTHVFLEHPENFGVDVSKIKVNLGERIDTDHQEALKKEAEAVWDEFKDFDRSLLTDEQKDTYDIYEYQNKISHELSDDKFDYYQQLFESMTGIHYQLPTLMSDWTLRNEQDVKDLITLVKDVKPYMEGAISYTKTQAEKGLLMIDIDSVKSYCDGIIEKGENSAVLTSMKESIDDLGLDEQSANTYKEQLTQAFVESFLPAYQDISDLMKELSKGTNNEEGLAKFKHGKEYFELLFQQNIGSEKSISEVKKMLQDDMNERIANMQKLMASNPDILKAILKNDMPVTNYTSYTDILDDISKKIKDDFPEVDNLKYNIKNVNEEIASDSGIAAYFNIPSIDGNGVKQLRVNPRLGDINTISTYQTVSHEGFPGHMYQYGYMYEHQTSPYRKTLASSNAYTEGFAVYAQYFASQYLTDIDQNLLRFIKENELVTYDIVILADIGIHYEGWSFDKYKSFLQENGIAMDDENTQMEYKQQQANPACFEPYYVGFHELDKLKTKAMEALGEKFDDKAFHEAILTSGNAPFSVVERNVTTYIDANK